MKIGETGINSINFKYDL